MGTTADRFSHPLLQILPGSLTIYIHAQQLHKHTQTRTQTSTCKNMLKTNTVSLSMHTDTHTRDTHTHTHIPINTLIYTQSHPALIHYWFSPGEVFVFGWSIKPFWRYNFWHTKAINTISSIQMCIWFGFSGLIRTNDCRDELKNTPILLFRHVIITIKHLTRNMEHQ